MADGGRRRSRRGTRGRKSRKQSKKTRRSRGRRVQRGGAMTEDEVLNDKYAVGNFSGRLKEVEITGLNRGPPPTADIEFMDEGQKRQAKMPLRLLTPMGKLTGEQKSRLETQKMVEQREDAMRQAPSATRIESAPVQGVAADAASLTVQQRPQTSGVLSGASVAAPQVPGTPGTLARTQSLQTSRRSSSGTEITRSKSVDAGRGIVGPPPKGEYSAVKALRDLPPAVPGASKTGAPPTGAPPTGTTTRTTTGTKTGPPPTVTPTIPTTGPTTGPPTGPTTGPTTGTTVGTQADLSSYADAGTKAAPLAQPDNAQQSATPAAGSQQTTSPAVTSFAPGLMPFGLSPYGLSPGLMSPLGLGRRSRSRRRRRGRSVKGSRSITHPGDLDYTTKRGDKDFHRDGHDIRLRRRPYTRRRSRRASRRRGRPRGSRNRRRSRAASRRGRSRRRSRRR